MVSFLNGKTSPLLKTAVQTSAMTGTDHQSSSQSNLRDQQEGGRDSGDCQTMYAHLTGTLNVKTGWCDIVTSGVAHDIVAFKIKKKEKKIVKTKNRLRHRGTLNVDAVNGGWRWTPVLTADWTWYLVHVNESLVKGQLPVASRLVFNNTHVTQRPCMHQRGATHCRG